VSRIHDALRRGPAPADTPARGRAARADAVLAALGCAPEQPRLTRPMLTAGALALAAVTLLAWLINS
jgi:hypothetical protein